LELNYQRLELVRIKVRLGLGLILELKLWLERVKIKNFVINILYLTIRGVTYIT
jgi:hypothetical protein